MFCWRHFPSPRPCFIYTHIGSLVYLPFQAYKAGRMATDPTTFWYKGELGFFDNYIIPLAKKLKECNVFGVSSDEYLNYALQNRAGKSVGTCCCTFHLLKVQCTMLNIHILVLLFSPLFP